MEKCPKCGFALPGDEAECPACGIVLAKYRAASAASPPPAAQPAAQLYSPTSPQVPPPAAPRVQATAQLAVHPPTLPAAPLITPDTLAALHSARPWLRFVVGYGFVVSILMALAGAGMMVGGLAKAELLAMGFVYLLYGAVGFALVLPLRRSVEALRNVVSLGPSQALEQFAVHHAVFWRRTGVVTAILLGLAVLAILAVVVFGGLAALSQ
jgi:hypothetical protein